MKTKLIITGILSFMWVFIFAQTAPVVTSGSVLYATTTPSSSVIHVTVKDFDDVGYFQLTLNYPVSSVSYGSLIPNSAFNTLSVNSTTPGKIILTWTGTAGISLPDETKLADLFFTYLNGNAAISWDTTGSACQFKKYASGLLQTMNDQPKKNHYFNGIITKSAPVVSAPVMRNVLPGNIQIPVTINKYNNIICGNLYLSYDTAVLTYLGSFALNSSFTGNIAVGSVPGTGGCKRLVIQWYGLTGVNLPDNSVFITLNFNFSTSQKNYSELLWYDIGPTCVFYDALGNELNDQPYSKFYNDGLISSVESPVATLPVISGAPASPSLTDIPVTVKDFTDISAFSLNFRYSSPVLNPVSFTAAASLPGLQVQYGTPDASGFRNVQISWSGSTTSLPDSSFLVNLHFTKNSGSTSLAWCTGQDSSWFRDQNGKQIFSKPVTQYFRNGLVSSHAAPEITAGSAEASSGQSLNIPVTVNNFNSIGSFFLTIFYDPSAVSYQSATPAGSLGGTFTALNPGPGKITLQWNGGPASLINGSVLLNLGFTSLGGTTSLQWLTTGDNCKYTESGSSTALFDDPADYFYHNGLISLPVVAPLSANIKIYLEGPYNGGGTMSTSLAAVIPHSQPFSGDPWNYNGTEQVISVPANVTDWILVELRTSPWASSKIATRAGFIKNDGTITDIDGTSLLHFPPVPYGNYYVVIKHRNHLAVMTSGPVTLGSTSSLYDFTGASSAVYGGINGYKKIDETLSKWGMIAGDANNSSSVYIDDYTEGWMPAFGTVSVYQSADFDMDGSVFITDYTEKWMPNFGRVSTIPE